MKKRWKESKRKRKRTFSKFADRTKSINMSPRIMRGGTRL
jgi:hypothetical protein